MACTSMMQKSMMIKIFTLNSCLKAHISAYPHFTKPKKMIRTLTLSTTLLEVVLSLMRMMPKNYSHLKRGVKSLLLEFQLEIEPLKTNWSNFQTKIQTFSCQKAQLMKKSILFRVTLINMKRSKIKTYQFTYVVP